MTLTILPRSIRVVAIVGQRSLSLFIGSNALIKFDAVRGLVFPNPAGDNFSLEIVFAANWSACDASQQRDLSDVGECVGDWALKDFLGRVS